MRIALKMLGRSLWKLILPLCQSECLSLYTLEYQLTLKQTKQAKILKNLSYSKHYTLWYYKEDIVPALEGIILH